MRNIIRTTIATIALVLMTTSAFAMVKEHQAYLGGVCQEMTIEQVENILGKDYEKTRLTRNRYSYKYANGFYIETTGNIVSYLEVESDNGIKTADGLHVGSTMAEVEDTLGRADNESGNYHLYTASGKKDIAFIYDGNKVVRSIYSGLSYEDEENIKRKEKEEKRNRRDPVDETLHRTQQTRDIYYTLRDIFRWRW